MKKLLIIVIVAISFSCDKKTNYSNDTPENLALGIFESLKDNNFPPLKKFLFHPSDSIFTNHRTFNNYLVSLSKEEVYSKYINEVEGSFQNLYEKGLKEGINWRNAKLHSILHEEYHTDLFNTIVLDNYLIRFTDNNKRYQFGIGATYSINNQWKSFYLIQLFDIEKENNRRLSKPYVPNYFTIEDFDWEYNTYDKKTFTKFFVTLKNKNSNDFDSYKYRVSIYTVNNGYKYEKFSKTFTSFSKMHTGDVVRVEVPDLRDFYTGVDLSNNNNLHIEAAILDASPRFDLIKTF